MKFTDCWVALGLSWRGIKAAGGAVMLHQNAIPAATSVSYESGMRVGSTWNSRLSAMANPLREVAICLDRMWPDCPCRVLLL